MFVHHSNICPANSFQYPNFAALQNPIAQTNYYQSQNLPKNIKKCHSKCDCGLKHSTTNRIQSKTQQISRKRKQTEKENIDSETLAKMKALEWEQRTGYW